MVKHLNKTFAIPTVEYGSQTWVIKKKQMTAVNLIVMKYLSKIVGRTRARWNSVRRRNQK